MSAPRSFRLSEEARFRLVERFPAAAMALFDLSIAFQWTDMWRVGAGRSQSIIGWAALVVVAAMWSCVYATLTPGSWRTILWSRLTVINASIGLLTVLHFRGRF